MRYLFLILILIIFSCQNKSQNFNEPDILLILSDDLGWSDIGAYGSEVKTPTLDRLAKEGMRFTSFHNTSKCFPSRATLLTGVYAQDCGYSKSHNNPIEHAVTLGEVLRTAGYTTLWSGKHHGLENPVTRGFDHYYGLKDGASNHFNPGFQREGEPKPASKRVRQWCMDSVLIEPYTPESKSFYTTDAFTDQAIEWLADLDNQPFFLFMSYTAPHDPLMAWPEDITKYEGLYDVGFDSIRLKRYQKQLEIGLIDSTWFLSDPLYAEWNSLDDSVKLFEISKMEVYAAMIDRLDQNISRLLSKIESLNRNKPLITMFMSDNGASAEVVNLTDDNDLAPVGQLDRWVSLGERWANVSNTPHRFYKNYSYEGGIKTPLIVHWPGVVPMNSFSDYTGHFIDIMPTLIDITGASYPLTHQNDTVTALRGESMLDNWKGEKSDRTKPLFFEWSDGAAVIHQGWKIVKEGDENWNLYNLKADPTETNNLASKNSDKLEMLRDLFADWKGGSI